MKTIASPASSAAAMTSSSRIEPPGWITAGAPALAAASRPAALCDAGCRSRPGPCRTYAASAANRPQRPIWYRFFGPKLSYGPANPTQSGLVDSRGAIHKSDGLPVSLQSQCQLTECNPGARLGFTRQTQHASGGQHRHQPDFRFGGHHRLTGSQAERATGNRQQERALQTSRVVWSGSLGR